ncbi:MAG: GWxTD domain-containing protein [Raineya sp.]|jgi:GWxTD domain-containing protein|nr:GWxTD domain-containing protein [Raineya sp.]
MKRFIFLIIIFFTTFKTFSQDKIVGAGGLDARFLILENNQTLRVYVQLYKNSLLKGVTSEGFQSRFKAYYKVKEDLSENPNWIANGAEIIWKNYPVSADESNIYWYFEIAMSQTSPTGILVLDLVDNEKLQKHQIVTKIAFTKTRIREEFAIFKENKPFPVLNGVVLEGENFVVQSLSKKVIDIYVTRIKQDYGAAQAPMNLSQPTQNKTLRVDTAFRIKTNELIKLNTKGLYLIRQDTNAFYGIGLRVESKNYPKYNQKEEILSPITYISQKSEIQKIEQTSDLKQGIDRFWLTLFKGDTEKAKEIIKNYYQRIRTANIRYASFKEGWKTDMGMIYTIFGEPDEIMSEKDTQRWTYRGNDSQNSLSDKGKNFTKINFTFLRRPNQFFEDYYVLVRYIEYEPVWTSMVEAIRRGIAF